MSRSIVSACLFVSFFSLAGCGEPKPAETANEAVDDRRNETASPMPPASTPDPTKKSANEYDKESTEVVLKRAGRSVKDSCGDAKDESGAATGPWGKVTIQVMLGRNGHSKSVTLPASHADKPAGKCIENAFSNLAFPPWAGQDTQVDWEVELVQPAAAAAPKKK